MSSSFKEMTSIKMKKMNESWINPNYLPDMCVCFA